MKGRRVKIHGAGSIGNHLAHAARSLGWDVTVCDLDPDALRRMSAEIYPTRYGSWDPSIEQHLSGDDPKGGFDLICVGTPPDVHLPVARAALDEAPGALLIEKPLCPPDLGGLDQFVRDAKAAGIPVFVGYDHVVGLAAKKVEELLNDAAIGRLVTLDVEFREHWAGIFAAHPWLSGPADSYLGFWERGGGASGEHSHALNLWQHFAHTADGGRVSHVTASIRYVECDGARYDDLCLMTVESERGLIGRVVQDVVTRPPRKWAVLTGERGALEWICAYDARGDAVRLRRPGKDDEVFVIPKTRPADFLEELRFIDARLTGAATSPALDLDRAVDTMHVLRAAHRSQREGRRVAVGRT